jgi:hypothetical protein
VTRLIWADKSYEAGVDRGVYFTPGGVGVAWNGLTDVKESPSEVDNLSAHIDGVRVYRRSRGQSFAGSIEAYTYPDAMFDDIFSQRRRKNFGLSYRVMTDDAYQIHLVYNVLLSAPEVQYTQEQSEANPFSWNFTTTPIPIPGMTNTAHLIVDAGLAWSNAVSAFETALYGDESSDARLPSPLEVVDIFEVNSVLRIVDNGDGTWTATGPDELVYALDATTFQINSPTVEFISDDTYTIRTW